MVYWKMFLLSAYLRNLSSSTSIFITLNKSSVLVVRRLMRKTGSVKVNLLDSGLDGSKSEFQSSCYVYFLTIILGKGMKWCSLSIPRNKSPSVWLKIWTLLKWYNGFQSRLKTWTSEFESHWVTYYYSSMPYLS